MPKCPKQPSSVPPRYAASRLGALSKQGTTLDADLGSAVLHLRPNCGRPLDRRYVMGPTIANYPLAEISAEEFKAAVSESHKGYFDVYSKWCLLFNQAAVFQSKGKAIPRPLKDAIAQLEKKWELLMDDVVWLVGGLLGRYDHTNNVRAREKGDELVKAAASRDTKGPEGRQKRDLRSSRVAAGRTAFARGKSRSKKPRDLKTPPVT